MYKKFLCYIIITLSFVMICDGSEQTNLEARGKKKKIALFVYVADLVLKKFFILKLVYAFVFWVVLHKAGYFLAWFASYLKDQKEKEYFHHSPSYDYHPSYSHGPYKRKTLGSV